MPAGRKVQLFIISLLVVIVTAVSFIVLRSVQDRVAYSGKTDKARLIYERAGRFLQQGMPARAVGGFVAVVKTYPASPFAEKALRDLASVYSRKGDFGKAGYYYRRLLKDFPGIDDAEKVRKELERSDVEKMLSPTITEDSLEYVVEPGDSLYAIANRFNVTVEMIRKTNGLRNDIIKPGQRLKINVSRFSILIDKSRNILVLNKDGEPFKTFNVATGRDNSTPRGVFIVVDKMVRPPWTRSDGQVIMPDSEEYELGERWIALSAEGYGIHGTKEDDTIGQQVTAGCIRMHNSDVIELYDIVPKGIEVEIVDD